MSKIVGIAIEGSKLYDAVEVMSLNEIVDKGMLHVEVSNRGIYFIYNGYSKMKVFVPAQVFYTDYNINETVRFAVNTKKLKDFLKVMKKMPLLIEIYHTCIEIFNIDNKYGNMYRINIDFENDPDQFELPENDVDELNFQVLGAVEIKKSFSFMKHLIKGMTNSFIISNGSETCVVCSAGYCGGISIYKNNGSEKFVMRIKELPAMALAMIEDKYGDMLFWYDDMNMYIKSTKDCFYFQSEYDHNLDNPESAVGLKNMLYPVPYSEFTVIANRKEMLDIMLQIRKVTSTGSIGMIFENKTIRICDLEPFGEESESIDDPVKTIVVSYSGLKGNFNFNTPNLYLNLNTMIDFLKAITSENVVINFGEEFSNVVHVNSSSVEVDVKRSFAIMPLKYEICRSIESE